MQVQQKLIISNTCNNLNKHAEVYSLFIFGNRMSIQGFLIISDLTRV